VELEGRIAVVTGGSRGIGAAACRAFARAGADVVVHYAARAADAEGVAADVRALGRRALTVGGDVAAEDDVARMAEAIAAFTDRVHVLFNNAGVYPQGSIDSVTPADWDRVLAVNVRGPFLVTRALLPLLRAGGRGGRVINVGTVLERRAIPGFLHYSTSKAAVAGFTRALAGELAPDGISVNCIVPSQVRTETTEREFPGVPAGIVADQLVPRYQEPEDLTGLLVFLASPASEWVTGQTLVAAGGRVFSS
jgi:3-oxoacyl-[acyl-carrier protein] reductase